MRIWGWLVFAISLAAFQFVELYKGANAVWCCFVISCVWGFVSYLIAGVPLSRPLLPLRADDVRLKGIPRSLSIASIVFAVVAVMLLFV
jgi:hypothetical protein